MKSSEKSKENEGACSCPYCDEGISLDPPPFCQPCHVELRRCVTCDIEVDRTAEVCPQCGQTIE